MDVNQFREMPSESQWAFLVAFPFILVLGLYRSVGGLFPLDVSMDVWKPLLLQAATAVLQAAGHIETFKQQYKTISYLPKGYTRRYWTFLTLLLGIYSPPPEEAVIPKFAKFSAHVQYMCISYMY